MATTRYNERSWAIDVIREIDTLSAGQRRVIRGAGGERTLQAGARNVFPDVLLYGDRAGASVLQGWELKMPDTSITDGDLLENAADKANLLGLDSFLVSNAETAVLHTREPDGAFSPEESWTVLAGPVDRQAVDRRSDEWRAALATIIDDLNDYFEQGEIRGRTLSETLSEAELITVALETAPALAESFQETAAADAQFRSRSQLWWNTVKQQFPDEDEPWDALARFVLLLWVNRVSFAHLLTNWCTDAHLVADLGDEVSPEEALEVFGLISDSCNFVNILSGSLGAEHVEGPAWSHLLQLNAFLSDLDLREVDQELFRNVLGALSHAARRRAAGQFTTPYALASLLSRLVLADRRAPVLDAFAGTGTIPKACLDAKRDAGLDQETALRDIWASDKFDIPVQITTLALTQPDAIGVPVKVFRADVQELASGIEVSFPDPETGDEIIEELPVFGGAASNLPFVQFEDLEDINPEITEINDFIEEETGEEYRLPSKSDLYAYLPFYLWRLVEPEGRVGLILSNSWMATGFGHDFRETLNEFYQIEQVVISGEGRWFEESDVVGTLIILRRREETGSFEPTEETQFVALEEPIRALEDSERCEKVVSRIEVSEENETITLNSVERRDIPVYEEAGLQWGAFFGDLDWLPAVRPLLTRASEFFSIGRGRRRGWNAMFYPDEGHGIEDRYILPALRSPSTVDGLIADPDSQAFCCGATLEELKEREDTGALAWIRRFENETNTKGEPLPEVLDRSSQFWYEMDDSAVADLVGLVNPGRRLFFPRMRERGFVDQRLIRFTANDDADPDLCHALLNSVISLYWLEAIGFGRGLGALDLNATKVKKRLVMFDPRALDRDQRTSILTAFEPLLRRDVHPIREELSRDDRRRFDEAVFSAYGIEAHLENVRQALLTLHGVRMAAVE